VIDSCTRKSEVFEFVSELAQGFLPSYLPIIEKNRSLLYTERERQWQLLRRGRYLEFNLLYDRGVRFGLEGGRFESIMVSGVGFSGY
jgi:coproporphyrinogen III oxidase